MTKINKIFFSVGSMFLTVLVFEAVPQIAMSTALAGENSLVATKQPEIAQGQSVSQFENANQRAESLVEKRNQTEQICLACDGSQGAGRLGGLRLPPPPVDPPTCVGGPCSTSGTGDTKSGSVVQSGKTTNVQNPTKLPAQKIEAVSQTLFVYDSYGRLVSSESKDAAGNTVSVTLFNLIAGKTVPMVTTYVDGSMSTNSYDAFGRIVSSEDRDSSGNLVSITGYTYDFSFGKFGRLVSSETRDAQGNMISTTLYSYDSVTGNLASAVTTNQDGSKSTTTYTYDQSGKKISEQTFDTQGALVSTTVYQYDIVSGKVLSSVTTYSDPKKKTKSDMGIPLTPEEQKEVLAALGVEAAFGKVDPASQWTTGNSSGFTINYFDAQGNLVGSKKVVVFSPLSGNPGSTTVTWYDANGKLVVQKGADPIVVIIPGGADTGYGYTVRIIGSVFEFVMNSSSNPVKFSIDMNHPDILTYDGGLGGVHVYKKGESGYENAIKTIADILTAAIRITTDDAIDQKLKNTYTALVKDLGIINGWEHFAVDVPASKRSGAFQITKNEHYWDTIAVNRPNFYLSLNTKDYTIGFITNQKLVLMKPGTPEWTDAFNKLSQFVEKALTLTKDPAQRSELKKILSDLAIVKARIMGKKGGQKTLPDMPIFYGRTMKI